MVGVGETYVAAFVLALGYSELWAGWIATLPLFAGGIIQLITPYGVNLFRSRRRWIVLCASLQALAFAPLIVGGFFGALPLAVIFAAVSFYWAAGMGVGPAWNAWMTGAVPGRLRARFFARRSRASNLGMLLGLAGGGVLLHLATQADRRLAGFAVLFAIAMVCRLASAWLASRQSEAPLPPAGERVVAGTALFKRFLRGADGRLLLYLGSMTAAVSVASPFFTPYMLKTLEFTYIEYMSLTATSFLAKILALVFLGRAAERWGAPVLARVAAVSIAVLPALWLVSANVPYLISLQILAGMAWATHEFAAFLLFFEHIDTEERTSLLSTFNFMNAAAAVVGSLLGGLLFQRLGEGVGGYHALFAISSGARVVVALWLLALSLRRGPVFQMSYRVVALRPTLGSFTRPILPSIRRRTSDRKEP